MRCQRVLDGLYFPHVLDSIFGYLPVESFACISQVCHQWRIIVKSAFNRLLLSGELSALGSRRNFSFYVRWEENKVCVLFGRCETLHTVVMKESPRPLSNSVPRPPLLANLKIVRSDASGYAMVREGLRVLHIKNASVAVTDCACSIGMRLLEVSRVVFTFCLLDWDMEEFQRGLPESWDSLWLIYLPGVDYIDHGQYIFPEQYWSAFHDLVRMAWEKGKSITIVNAASLIPLRAHVRFHIYSPDDLPPAGTEGKLLEDIFRSVAVEALVPGENEPPGPVCPVHFVTLKEYRAHVGEAEFQIDTKLRWRPKSSGTGLA